MNHHAQKKHQRSANEKRTKLLGGYLRTHLMGNIDSPEPAKELVRRSFRYLKRKQGLMSVTSPPNEPPVTRFFIPGYPSYITVVKQFLYNFQYILAPSNSTCFLIYTVTPVRAILNDTQRNCDINGFTLSA